MSPVRILLYEIKEVIKQSKWLPLITAYAVLSGIIGPGIHYPLLHLPFLAIGVLFALKSSLKFELTAILLLLYLLVNVVITRPPAVFNAWTRLALFASVFLFASPLLRGQYIGVYRRKILMGILGFCVVLGIGSFFCYFLGINYMHSQGGDMISDYQTSYGGFGGLLVQSISLGMVSGLGMLYLLYRALKQPKNERKWYFVAIVVLSLTVLLSASRTALLSAITGMLVMVYLLNKKNGKFLQVLIVILFVGMLTYPLWEDFTTGIESKNSTQMELGAYGSRTEKWTARMTEFASSPIVGIGYASVNPSLDDVGVGGVIEPGSSWLAILSMTGIIGFILVIMILIKPFQYLRTHPTPYNSLLLGLMVYICTHMISEGYIFAGGSALCFMAWLIFGCCNDARYFEMK
jgi:O-antigen ligase